MSQDKDSITTIRITATGDCSSDKVKLLYVFKGDPYPEDYDPPFFDNFHEMHTYQGKQYNIHLWDTPSEQEDKNTRFLAYFKTDVLLICFALNDPDSLKCVTEKWIVEARENCPKASIILIGTKSELWKPNEEGEITQAQIDEVAKEIEAYKTIICSARNNVNICDIFELAIEAYLAKKRSDSYCKIA